MTEQRVSTDQPQVAVVDDDPRLRMLLQEELQDLGVVPLLCDNGLALLALLEKQSVDLILLDLMMPVMDGSLVWIHCGTAVFQALWWW